VRQALTSILYIRGIHRQRHLIIKYQKNQYVHTPQDRKYNIESSISVICSGVSLNCI
jgi:hypothetical protein